MERNLFNFFSKYNKPIDSDKTKLEPKQEKILNPQENITPAHLRLYGDKVIDLFCKAFSVEGLENVQKIKKENPQQKFIISAAHLNNLDAPAALKVFGKEFNLQLTGESVLLEKMKYLAHRMMINLAGRDNFTALDYIEDKDSKRGSFNPENFTELAEKINEGKTPWIAGNPFSLDGKMRRSSIGPVYMACKTDSLLIPTALDISGGSVNLEGALESAKTLADRSRAVYRIGEPFKVAPIDLLKLDNVLAKRREGVEISREELAEFSQVHKQLREQADLFEQRLAQLLPEEKRRDRQ